jgi:hypothetical protein
LIELVRYWHSREADRSVIKPILDEISELSLSFSFFNVVFARREANQTAHSCAKYTILHAESFLWDAEPPAFLVQSFY